LDQHHQQDQLQSLSRTTTELSNRRTIHLGLVQIHLVLDYQKARPAFNLDNLDNRTTGQNLSNSVMDLHLRSLLLEHPFRRRLGSWRIGKDHLHLSRMHSNRVPLDRHLPFHHSKTLFHHRISPPRLPPRHSSEVRKAQHQQPRPHITTEAIESNLSLPIIPHNGLKVVDPMHLKDHRISEPRIILYPPYRLYQCEEHLREPVD
jgi:hypothetical protein